MLAAGHPAAPGAVANDEPEGGPPAIDEEMQAGDEDPFDFGGGLENPEAASSPAAAGGQGDLGAALEAILGEEIDHLMYEGARVTALVADEATAAAGVLDVKAEFPEDANAEREAKRARIEQMKKELAEAEAITTLRLGRL